MYVTVAFKDQLTTCQTVYYTKLIQKPKTLAKHNNDIK